MMSIKQVISPAGQRFHLSKQVLVLGLLGLVVLAAAVARGQTFDRFLPYMDYGDETNMYLLGRDWLGVEHDPVVPDWLAGYPPLYVWISMGGQRLTEQFTTRPWLLPTDYIYQMRALAAIIGVLTTGVIMAAAYQAGGAKAGWLAGMVWGLAPVIVNHNSLAIPDPFVYLSTALAILFALRAWSRAAPGWAWVSLVFGIVSIYLKYPAAYVLLPGGLVMLHLWYHHPRRTFPWIVLSVLMALVAALYLILGYDMLRLSNREADTVRGEGLGLMLNQDRNRNNWHYAIYPIGQVLFRVVIGGGLLAYGISVWRKWRTIKLQPLAMLVVFCIIGIAISASFSRVWLGAGKLRHTFPMSVALIIIWATFAAQISWTLSDGTQWIYRQFRQSRPQARQIIGLSANRLSQLSGGVIITIITVVFCVGNIDELVDLVRHYDKTFSNQVLWEWADASIPVEGIILMHEQSAAANTWNRNYNGYDGYKGFQWWYEDITATSTIAAFVERGITYFAVSPLDYERYYPRPEQRAFIDQLTLLKTVGNRPGEFGPIINFYRLEPLPNPSDITFGGELTLVGYEMGRTELAPGDTFYFRPYWQIERPLSANYSMYIHVYPLDETQIIVQHDGPPGPPTRDTLTWDDPDEIFYGPDVYLPLPADLAPGQYRVALGIYDYTTGARLPLETGAEFHTFLITVTADTQTN